MVLFHGQIVLLQHHTTFKGYSTPERGEETKDQPLLQWFEHGALGLTPGNLGASLPLAGRRS